MMYRLFSYASLIGIQQYMQVLPDVMYENVKYVCFKKCSTF